MAQKKPRASVPWSALDSAAVPTDMTIRPTTKEPSFHLTASLFAVL
jgi:hypothetical protein